MRLQLLACKVLQREAYFCASRSKNIIDIVMLPQGLHNEPEKLRTELQKRLEQKEDIQGNPYDATLIGYGLCSNGIVGLKAEIPIVVPRGHDCVTLLLGSKENYKQYFDNHRGVYWYSCGWIEAGKMPCKHRYEELYNEYEEKYGEDNAKYLLELENNWISEYSRAVYVDWGLPNSNESKRFTKEAADFLKWEYVELKGDPGLMQKLLDGQWDKSECLIVEPGQQIRDDVTDDGIIKAE
jgi:hypothetical protein